MENWRIASDYIFDRAKLNFLKRWWLDIDRVSFLLVIGVIIFGLIMSTVSSPYIAKKIGVEKFFFIKKQIVFSSLAIIVLIIISFFNIDQIKAISMIGSGIVLVLLVVVLIFGHETKGAKRWISIWGFALQPSEFIKPLFLVLNAFLLQRFSGRKWYVKYGVSGAFFAVTGLLLILQPDFGMTTVLVLLWLAQLFIFGLPLALIGVISSIGVLGAFYAYLSMPHVANRVDKFLNIDQKNYQVERSIDAYVNGGFFGTGPGDGLVKRYIPDAHTDFIFAVVAEEFGVITCLAIIVIFFTLIRRAIKNAMTKEDMFSYLAIIGLISQFTLQIIINIGVSVGLFPTKGMTLPFISYGGSSVLAMSLCFGMILALTKKKYDDQINYKNIVL